MKLYVYEKNVRAIRFYLKNNFVIKSKNIEEETQDMNTLWDGLIVDIYDKEVFNKYAYYYILRSGGMEEKTLEVFKKGSKLLNILQDEKRQQMLVLLCREEQLTVNQITELLPISRPAVSHHLKLMYEVGLLTVKQEGLERYYSSDLEDALLWLKELTTSLEENIKNKETI